MKTVAVFLLVVLLAGCSASGNDAARLTSLQKQVDALSAKVNKIEATKTAITDFDLQEKCAVAAKRDYLQMKTSDAADTYDGFVSNYNKSMGHCFMVYESGTGSFAADSMHDTTIADAIRGMNYAQYDSLGTETAPPMSCWVRWRGKIVHYTSRQQFDEYRGRFMGTPLGTASAQE